VCATTVDNSGVYVYYLKDIVSVCFRCPARTVGFSGTRLYLCIYNQSSWATLKRYPPPGSVGAREDYSPVVTMRLESCLTASNVNIFLCLLRWYISISTLFTRAYSRSFPLSCPYCMQCTGPCQETYTLIIIILMNYLILILLL